MKEKTYFNERKDNFYTWLGKSRRKHSIHQIKMKQELDLKKNTPLSI